MQKYKVEVNKRIIERKNKKKVYKFGNLEWKKKKKENYNDGIKRMKSWVNKLNERKFKSNNKKMENS